MHSNTGKMPVPRSEDVQAMRTKPMPFLTKNHLLALAATGEKSAHKARPYTQMHRRPQTGATQGFD
jgi:hypothetical protein